jgi:hypothetical protein
LKWTTLTIGSIDATDTSDGDMMQGFGSLLVATPTMQARRGGRASKWALRDIFELLSNGALKNLNPLWLHKNDGFQVRYTTN